ncbi:isoaspartyl peptidase/L-asparaginase family protein [Erythrobacter sp. W53]|uniref:isoaspartyl peptidase/L-asparaginase family protein n=1 Tax=Erythrobacter sp. W53 TaxID=3425947 RepID=UPI003D767F5E
MLGGQVLAQDALVVDSPKWSIAIHGGAGTITRERMTPELEAEYEAALQNALDAGARILAEGGTATDAVQAAIVLMEDDPKFNAGRGAVYTWDGANELDASIMDGRDRSAGAVTGVTSIKNPILLADKVRTESVHVFLSGKGAEEFAATQDIETAGPEWFGTERRKEALERVKAQQLSALDIDHKFGTVGAVALDQDGNLAAGTSTGGMTGKRWGRIGDAPVIGAGTYADNRSCAVSATGWGEYFIRVGVAQSICSRLMMFNLLDPEIVKAIRNEPESAETKINEITERREIDSQRAADAVMREVKQLGGDGGVILVTPEGHALYSFNTAGMYRGRATSEGVNEVAIFGEVLAGEE